MNDEKNVGQYRNPSLSIMARRLGYMNQSDIPELPREPQKEETAIDKINGSLESYDLMKSRLGHNGGFGQQGRMVLDKVRTLKRALWYSYQGADVKIVQSLKDNYKKEPFRGLINPDKLKQDYDDKIFSTLKETGVQAGDVLEWVGTNTYWLTYLQDIDEIGYFKSAFRRCKYTIDWVDEDGNVLSTYAAIRGPVETKIDFIQKQGVSVDEPNHTLNILIPKSDAALKFFRRYSKFYLKGCSDAALEVCWRVEAINWIGISNVLEINATEYYINTAEDDLEAKLAGTLITKPVNPNTEAQEDTIVGESIISPKCQYNYTAAVLSNAEWYIDTKKYPVKYQVNPNNPKECAVYWKVPYSGQFEIKYGRFSKIIVVESPF